MAIFTGQIKNFISLKGFGFISCPELEGDVYFQRRDLPEDLQVHVGDDIFSFKGLGCSFESVVTKDGKAQARNVKVGGGDGLNMLGTVKNYNPKNGYGFISSSMWEGDLYFKGRDLPPQLAASDLRGFKVRFTAAAMQDGKMQARDVVVLSAGAPGGAAQVPMAQQMGFGLPMSLQSGLSQSLGLAAPSVVAPPAQAPRRAAPTVAQPLPGPAGGLGHTIPEGTSMVGAVKTFDPAKGYGFIAAPNFPVDIYFKPESEMVLPGQQVTFTIHFTQQGKPQAREVTSPMAAGEVYTGTVRRYNPNTGYGFLSVDGRSQDVYFQKKDLPAQLQEVQLDGAQFQFGITLSNMNKPQGQDLELLSMPTGGVKRPLPTQAPGGGVPAPVQPATKRFRPTPSAMAPEPVMPTGLEGLESLLGPLGGAAAAQMMAAAGIPALVGGSAGMADGKTRGTVKSFNPMKGFGFIACPSLPTDVYFNAKSLPDAYKLLQLEGQQVAFNVRYTQDGKIQGTDVQVGV